MREQEICTTNSICKLSGIGLEGPSIQSNQNSVILSYDPILFLDVLQEFVHDILKLTYLCE